MSSIENNNVVELVAKELHEFNTAIKTLPEVHLSTIELDHSWEQIRERVNVSAWRRSVLWYSAAACVAIALVFFAGRFQPQTTDPFVIQVENSITNKQAPAPISLETLKQYNQLMEARIQSLPDQPSLVRANTIDTITRLEDQIALLDYRLASLEQQSISQTEYRTLYILR